MCRHDCATVRCWKREVQNGAYQSRESDRLPSTCSFARYTCSTASYSSSISVAVVCNRRDRDSALRSCKSVVVVFCVFGVLLPFRQSLFLFLFFSPQGVNMAASVLSSARCLSGASNTFGLSSNNAGAGAGQTVRRYSVVQVNAIAEKTSADTEVPQDVLAYAKSLPGISQPFPNIFDPAALLARAASSRQPIRELRRWREAEITHGRVAMLASLGFIVQEQLEDFPVFYNIDGHITGPAIYHFQQVEARGAVFWEPLIFAIALAEAYRVGLGWANPRSEDFNFLREDYEPGNLGFDPLGLLPSDPEAKKDLQTKELNNGRLAMIAIAAFVVQELVSGEEVFAHTFKKLGL